MLGCTIVGVTDACVKRVLVGVGIKVEVGFGVGLKVGLTVGVGVLVGRLPIVWVGAVVSFGPWAIIADDGVLGGVSKEVVVVFLGLVSFMEKVRVQGGVRALVFGGVALLNSLSLNAVVSATTPIDKLEMTKNIKIKFFLIKLIASLFPYQIFLPLW